MCVTGGTDEEYKLHDLLMRVRIFVLAACETHQRFLFTELRADISLFYLYVHLF